MRIHLRRLAGVGTAACAIALFTASTSAAQESTEAAVRAVVDSFFADVAVERWDAAAALLDMSRFEPFFKQRLREVRSSIRVPDLTADELMARDSTMPRAVAEWQAEKVKESRSSMPFGDYSYEFAGITSQHELLTLSPTDAAARWLAAQDERTQMRESMRRAGCPLSAMLGALPRPNDRVLAIAFAGDSAAYVVHVDDRLPSVPDQLMPNERVMALRRTGATWRITPQRDLLHPANFGFASVECARRPG